MSHDLGYPGVPIDHAHGARINRTKHPEGDELPNRLHEALRYYADAINSLRNGKINTRGLITLTENSATTTLEDKRIAVHSFVDFVQTTANAAAEKASGNMYWNSASGVTTITHTNNGQTDRTFVWVVLG